MIIVILLFSADEPFFFLFLVLKRNGFLWSLNLKGPAKNVNKIIIFFFPFVAGRDKFKPTERQL